MAISSSLKAGPTAILCLSSSDEPFAGSGKLALPWELSALSDLCRARRIHLFKRSRRLHGSLWSSLRLTASGVGLLLGLLSRQLRDFVYREP